MWQSKIDILQICNNARGWERKEEPLFLMFDIDITPIVVSFIGCLYTDENRRKNTSVLFLLLGDDGDELGQSLEGYNTVMLNRICCKRESIIE